MTRFFNIFYFFSILIFIFVTVESNPVPLPLKYVVISITLFLISQMIRIQGRVVLYPIKASLKINLFVLSLEEFISWLYADKVKAKLLKREGCLIRNLLPLIITYRLLLFLFWTSIVIILLPSIVYSFTKEATYFYYAATLLLILSLLGKFYFFQGFLRENKIKMTRILYAYFLLSVSFMIETLAIYYLISPYVSQLNIITLLFVNAITTQISLFFIPKGLGFKELIFSYLLSLMYGSFGFFCFIALFLRFYSVIFYFVVYMLVRYGIGVTRISS